MRPNNIGVLDDSVFINFSSQAFLANKSLLDMIKSLIMGGSNSTIKKKVQSILTR